MKILYIPLDERPCNYEIPQMVVESKHEIELIVPPIEYLGNKKKSADLDQLWDYVNENIKDVDAAVLNIDMLLFGGLIPSRVHNLNDDVVDGYFNNLKNLKSLNPKLNLYVSECIMRSPQYDSSDEEPDYYADYGRALHRNAFLKDKKEREELTEKENKELNEISIPKEIQEDYEWRRDFNLSYNLQVAGLVKEGLIDFLVIPQDDSAEFGYTAIAQKEVVTYLSDNNLESRVNIYPGADEVGTSLLARCLNDYHKRKTAVYAFYSSTLGPTIIPNYEDRPMNENLKYHLDVTNSYLVDNPSDADFILAINSPGKIMEEAFNQSTRDISYTSFRNLLYFVKEIERYIEQGYKVSICDSAFSNGGDLQLIKFLDERDLLDKLLAYAGWNTNSNTLGTVLGSSIYGYDEASSNHYHHLVYRLLEDVFYQSYARQEVDKNYLPKLGISYYDFQDKQAMVESKIGELIKVRYNNLNVSRTLPIEKLEITLPWSRMFEIGMDIKIKH